MKLSELSKKTISEFREISTLKVLGFISSLITIIVAPQKLTDPLSLTIFWVGVIFVIVLYFYLFRLRNLLKKKFDDVNSKYEQNQDSLRGILQSRFDTLDSNFEHNQERLKALDHIIEDYFGYAWRENKYFRRSHDFTEEKKMLANSLVRNLLPDILAAIEKEHSQSGKKVRFILDSGTTITPVFPCLVRHGFPGVKANKIDFYTNNLAGIDEIHRIPEDEESKFSERNFNLIGGRPLNQYRATTGDFTQDILADLFKEQEESEGKIISIGIITANWFLAGISMDRLSICGKGEGHLEFKQSLVDHCHYIVLLTPLGKLLPIDKIENLNEILNKDYKAFEIPEEKRNQTYLHTTFRDPISSPSPLLRISERLNFVRGKNNNKNYIFSEYCSFLEDQNNLNRAQATRMDLPHDYIKKNFYQIYGYELSLVN